VLVEKSALSPFISGNTLDGTALLHVVVENVWLVWIVKFLGESLHHRTHSAASIATCPPVLCHGQS